MPRSQLPVRRLGRAHVGRRRLASAVHRLQGRLLEAGRCRLHRPRLRLRRSCAFHADLTDQPWDIAVSVIHVSILAPYPRLYRSDTLRPRVLLRPALQVERAVSTDTDCVPSVLNRLVYCCFVTGLHSDYGLDVVCSAGQWQRSCWLLPGQGLQLHNHRPLLPAEPVPSFPEFHRRSHLPGRPQLLHPP